MDCCSENLPLWRMRIVLRTRSNLLQIAATIAIRWIKVSDHLCLGRLPMRHSLPIALLISVFASPVFAQPLNPPANLYIISNTRTDLIATFATLNRCQEAAAAHKIIPVGNGPVSVILVCVPTQ
jgi:hypothetical protein